MTDSLPDELRTTLGSAYRLEHELGGGGMSRVFLAEERALTRRVVIKVLSPALAATISVERFRREVRVAAGLHHAHIVPVLSAGVVGELPYYTMPFVDGESVRDRIRRAGALEVSQAVRVLTDVSEALAYAHGRGIVHRDIKPANVLLSDGAAFVTDFGIAKALGVAGGVAGPELTSQGVAPGSPGYMAPEQIAGDPAADYRADLYSFGVLGYEMLVGAPLFAGRSPHSVLSAHVLERPDDIRARRRDVPARLAHLLMQCLEKVPADRPRDAATLADNLREIAAALGTGILQRTTAGEPTGRRLLESGPDQMDIIGPAIPPSAGQPLARHDGLSGWSAGLHDNVPRAEVRPEVSPHRIHPARRYRALAIYAVVLATALGGWVWWQAVARAPADTPEEAIGEEFAALFRRPDSTRVGRMLLLTPVNLTGDSSLDTLAGMLAERLPSSLAHRARLVPAESAARLERVAAATPAPTSTTGRVLQMLRASRARVAVATAIMARNDTAFVGMTLYYRYPAPRSSATAGPGRRALRSPLGQAPEAIGSSGVGTRGPRADLHGVTNAAAKALARAVRSMESCAIDDHLGADAVPFCWRGPDRLGFIRGLLAAELAARASRRSARSHDFSR
jgi:serine/threonine protein kinase